MQLEREKKEAKVYTILLLPPSTNSHQPCLHPLSLSPPHSPNAPLHPSKLHTRATRVVVPHPARRDIPQPRLALSKPSRLSFVAPVHCVGDEGVAGHYPFTLPEWCATSRMFYIPTLLARCRILRICRNDTRLGLRLLQGTCLHLRVGKEAWRGRRSRDHGGG